MTSPISIHDLLWFFVAAQVPLEEEEEEEEVGEKEKNEKNDENKEKKKEVKKDVEVIGLQYFFFQNKLHSVLNDMYQNWKTSHMPYRFPIVN